MIGNQYFESGIAQTTGGCGDTNVVQEHKNDMVSTYYLDLFPNVVKNNCHITFSIPQPSKISLKLFDVSGRLVKTIYEGYSDIASKTINLNVSEFANGVYIVVLESSIGKQQTKFVKLK